MYTLRNLATFCLLTYFCCFSEKALAYPSGTELKVGAFFATDGHLRNSLNTPLPIIELESSYHFNACWDMWTAVGYIYGNGRTCHTGVRKSLIMVPISIGVRKYFCLGEKFDGFIGVGGVWGLYHENIRCHSRSQRINKSGPGAVLRAGYQFVMGQNITMEFSAEYLFQFFQFHRRRTPCHSKENANMSGTKFAIGLMYDY